MYVDESRQMLRVTVWGLLLNLVLAALKFSVGIVVNSAALVADAVHSISDIATDFIVILGIGLSSRPSDKTHHFGHGKFETIASFVIGSLLVAAGLYVTWNAGSNIYEGESNIPGYPVVVVAAVAILAKEGIYQVTQRVARRLSSSVLSLNAWHHRSDALSSIAVLLGAIAGLGGWDQADNAAAIVVGMMVASVGVESLWRVLRELAEGSISEEEQASIIEAIQSVPGVKNWHKLRTRLVGREIFMDVHILVDGQISVTEGHLICSAVERTISESTARRINSIVHCEPYFEADVKE